MGRPFKCPFCGGSRNSAKGVRHTKLLGIRRIRKCKLCNRRFTVGVKHPKPAAPEAA